MQQGQPTPLCFIFCRAGEHTKPQIQNWGCARSPLPHLYNLVGVVLSFLFTHQSYSGPSCGAWHHGFLQEQIPRAGFSLWRVTGAFPSLVTPCRTSLSLVLNSGACSRELGVVVQPQWILWAFLSSAFSTQGTSPSHLRASRSSDLAGLLAWEVAPHIPRSAWALGMYLEQPPRTASSSGEHQGTGVDGAGHRSHPRH